MYLIIGGILALIVFSIGIISITNDKVMKFISDGELQQSLYKELCFDNEHPTTIKGGILIYITLILVITILMYVAYPLIIGLFLYFRYILDRINNRKKF